MDTSLLSSTGEMGDHDYLKLRQRIADLELALANQTSSSNKEIMVLEERSTKLRASFEKNELLRRKVEYELTAARKQLNDEIRHKKQECDLKKKEVESCKEELSLKSKDIKSMEKVLHDQSVLFDKERERLVKEIDNLSKENINLKNENKDLKGKNDDLTNQCSVAAVQINSKNVEIDYSNKLRKDHNELFQKEKEELSNELEDLKAKNEELRVENDNISLGAQKTSDDLMNRYQKLEETISKKISDLKTVETKNKQIDKEKEALIKEVILLKQENDKITKNHREKTEELNEKCSLLETQRIEHTSTIHKLVDDNKSIYNNEQEWIVKNKELQARNKSFQENIEAERASHLETKFNTELLELKINDIKMELMQEKENLKIVTSLLEKADKTTKQMVLQVSDEKKLYTDSKDRLDKRIFELENIYDLQCKELTDKSVALSNNNLVLNELKEELAVVKSRLDNHVSNTNDVIKELKVLFTNYGGKCNDDDWNLQTVVEVLKPLLSDSSIQIKATENNLEVVQTSLEKLTLELDVQRRDIVAKEKALEEAEKLVHHVKQLCSTTELKCSDYENQIKDLENEKNGLTCKLEQKDEEIKVAQEGVRTAKLELDQSIESTLSALSIMHDLLMTGAVQPSYIHSISMNSLKDTIIDKLKQNINNDRLRSEELDKYENNNKRLTTELRHHKKANRKLRKVNAGLLFQTEKYLEDAKGEKQALENHLNEYNTAFKALENEKRNAAEKCTALEQKLNETQHLYENASKDFTQCEIENNHLNAAIVVIAGVLWRLINQHRSLCIGKSMLISYNMQVFKMKEELVEFRNMIMCNLFEKPVKNLKHHRQLHGIFRFRVAVISVLVANRFSKIAIHTKMSKTLKISQFQNIIFYEMNNVKNVEEVQSSIVNNTSEITKWMNDNNVKKICFEEIFRLLSSFKNSNISEKHGDVHLETLVDKISNFFDNYINKINMESSSIFSADSKGTASLFQSLGLGLKRLIDIKGNSVYLSVSKITSDLCQSIVESSNRHICSEEERLSFKSNCERYKEERNQLKSELCIHISQLEETEKTLKSHVVQLEERIEQAITEDQFNEVCNSLNDALKREKNLQVLLKQQKNEISEITSKIEKQEEHYQQSINIFTANLKNQQKEFQGLEGKMGGLKDILSKLETEKEELNVLLVKEQETMVQLCLERDLLGQFIRKVASTIQKSDSKIDLSLINKLNKILATILPEKLLERDGKKITPEMLLCQNTVVSFVEAQKRVIHHMMNLMKEKHQLSGKISSLEDGAKSHRINVQKLKSQISALCQDDNSDFTPSMSGAKETSSPIFVPLEMNYNPHF